MILIHTSRECFLTSLINFLSLKILSFIAKFLSKSDLLGFCCQNFLVEVSGLKQLFDAKLLIKRLPSYFCIFQCSKKNPTRVTSLKVAVNMADPTSLVANAPTLILFYSIIKVKSFQSYQYIHSYHKWHFNRFNVLIVSEIYWFTIN